jgi:predicted transcriptional regulator
MAFTIQNRANHLLVIPLNSGETLHLAPGETSPSIESFELEKNEKVERLLSEGLIASTQAEGEAAGGAAPGGSKGRAEKRAH